MKSFALTATIAMLCITASSQSSTKVTWKYSANKIGNRAYEIHLTAVLSPGWLIYAQGVDGEKTNFSFNSNNMATLDGKPKEEGKMIQKKYTVDFVQKVKLKTDASTIISGNIRFTAYNNIISQILPSSKVTFSIKVGG